MKSRMCVIDGVEILASKRVTSEGVPNPLTSTKPHLKTHFHEETPRHIEVISKNMPRFKY